MSGVKREEFQETGRVALLYIIHNLEISAIKKEDIHYTLKCVL